MTIEERPRRYFTEEECAKVRERFSSAECDEIRHLFALERLRYRASAAIQSVRSDMSLTEGEKHQRVSELLRENAARAWALIEESRKGDGG